MWEFVERAAEELYREAGLDPWRADGAAEVAAGILGPDCIRFVPGDALPGRAELARLKGRWRIFLHHRLSAEDMHHAIGHELGHLWVKRNLPNHPEEEELADRIGAALCAPHGPYMKAHRTYGWRPRKLGKLFVLRPHAAALRLGECTGSPVALVSPKRIRVRGNPWPWPEEASLRAALSGGLAVPGIRTVRLSGARALLHVVA
jgi:hypothetical protein